jgi:hypothetical protein
VCVCACACMRARARARPFQPNVLLVASKKAKLSFPTDMVARTCTRPQTNAVVQRD